MNSPLTLALLFIVAAVATETVIYWHRKTRGTWREWPAGRSLMYLLIIISSGFGYGVINRFLGDYPARNLVSFVLYALFIGALLVIRKTIAAEMRRGRDKPLTTKLPTTTGPVDVAVASENQETPDETR
jgi:uncharacterized membrane protein YfcA